MTDSRRSNVVTRRAVAIVGGLAVASAAIQVTMNWAQRSVSPTKATVIYAGEPVWAALLGRLAGERLTTTALTGGALIVLAVLISELRVRIVTMGRS